ncbi:amidase [Desulfatiferula olefinivorans]
MKQPLAGLYILIILALVQACTTPMNIQGAAAVIRTDRATDDRVFLCAHEMAEGIRSGQFTSLELITACLDHIDVHNPALNAMVTLDREGALARARQADDARSRGEWWGPLHGVPVTIKDNVATCGMRTTSSMEKTAEYIPEADAPVVERLRKAGAIILGKTNLPALGMDYQTRSPLFGVTNNPWDLTRTPGGSTGGGAAAVAAGFTPLEIGNDIGGSIRIPAHFCGIYGLKPTEHRVPNTGLSPGLSDKPFRSIRHQLSIGPLARSIEDLKLCLSIIAGPDGHDPDVPDLPLSEPPKKALTDLKIAWIDTVGDVPVSAETQEALARFAAALAGAGCTIEKVSTPGLDVTSAWRTYGKLIDLETGVYSPPVARFFQYLLGSSYRKNTPTISMAYPMSYETYLTVLTRREEYMLAMDRFLSSYDALICPVHTTAAYPHIEADRYFGPYPIYKKPFAVDGQTLPYMVANGAYTTLFNLTGHPVVVMPVGYDNDHLPIGIQVVGHRWHDLALLDTAAQLDTVAGAYRRPPGF